MRLGYGDVGSRRILGAYLLRSARSKLLRTSVAIEPRSSPAAPADRDSVHGVADKKKERSLGSLVFLGRGTWNRTTILGFGDPHTNRCTMPLKLNVPS